jgi:hypothetical protein
MLDHFDLLLDMRGFCKDVVRNVEVNVKLNANGWAWTFCMPSPVMTFSRLYLSAPSM